jgi:hypothetical protein
VAPEKEKARRDCSGRARLREWSWFIGYKLVKAALIVLAAFIAGFMGWLK